MYALATFLLVVQRVSAYIRGDGTTPISIDDWTQWSAAPLQDAILGPTALESFCPVSNLSFLRKVVGPQLQILPTVNFGQGGTSTD